MFDSNLRLRTTGAASLTATETSSAFTINETPIGGLALVVNIPKRSVGDTMQVTLRASSDDSTYTDLCVLDTVASIAAASTVPQTLRQVFSTRLKYVKTVTTVAGTSPDFGIVTIDITDAMGNYANNYTVTAATSAQGT